MSDATELERWRSMWEKEQAHNEQLTAELDHLKARAERAEAALVEVKGLVEIKGYAETGSDCIFDSCPMCSNTLDTLAQIDAEPVDPRQPTVQEAARVLMKNSDARDAAFCAMWVVAQKHSLEATNNGGARYSITGDVVNELYYAALRALAEGDSQ